MDYKQHLTEAGTLAEELVRVRRYHACGEELWFAEQATPPTYFHEYAPGAYSTVTECVRCRQKLTLESLRVQR